MTDEFDPLNPNHLAKWKAWDDYHAKVADIKTIPPSPDDIQFKIPDIRPAPWVPKGTIYVLPPRHADETDEEFGARCVKITGIGDPKDD